VQDSDGRSGTDIRRRLGIAALSHGLTLPPVDPEKVIPGHRAAYLPDINLAHRSLRIRNMDPTVRGHETAAGISHAVPTSNSGHQVAGQGTQYHGD